MLRNTTKYILIAFIAATIFQACSEAKSETPTESAAPTEKVTTVKTAEVTTTKQAMPIVSTGMLVPKDEIKLSFKIGGVIADILVEEGQFVKKGQLIAKLEQEEINAQVAQAQSALTKAERDLARAKNLYADTVGTLELVQNAETGKEVAASNLSIAQFNQRYANIYAPTSGTILVKRAEPQEITGPGNPIVVMTPSNKSKVMRVGVADKDLVKIKLGDRAKITFDAYPNQVFTARVSELPQLPDEQTGTFPIELTVNSKGKMLRNGFIGKIELNPSTSVAYYKIPIEALVEVTSSTAYIYIPDGNQAKRIEVQPQEIGQDHFIISKSGEQLVEVITEGAPYLANGSKINIQN
jgi:RND family efflux transporter MFP subunit